MTAIFPDVVERYLVARYGPPATIDLLSGLSGAGVWRVRFERNSLIVKATRSGNEPTFYEIVAPALRSQGLALPDLEWSATISDTPWLIMEDIPLAFPQTRWLADAEQLAFLRRLHQSDVPAWPELPGAYRPQWSSAMTDAALEWLAPSSAALRPILESFQAAAQPLFAPTCLISADPNPNNWGLRQDGALVLFDWERFCRAAPALDVAITVPGLGDPAAMELVAARYLATHDQGAVAAFVREMTIAKAWTVVELFSFLGPAGPPPHQVVAHLCEHFPAWLEQAAQTYL
jgi:hypothetical protein